MNGNLVKALALDAIYQVLDNWVFRILVILVALPILFFFVVGFREDSIVILFGVAEYSYDWVGGLSGGIDPRDWLVRRLTSIFIDFFGGTIGVVLSIAATAFFVPRMIEKGSADVLFHKPVHRGLLYLSRYAAGLLFICTITVLAVVGIYAGQRLVSGFNDPGILWAALTLTYLFGLLHCVSMLIGVLTRSTVAAILVTLIFYVLNGGVHNLWIFFQQMREESSAAEMVAALQQEDQAEGEDGEEDGPNLMVTLLDSGLSVAHYILPKTTDATFITDKLRKTLEGRSQLCRRGHGLLRHES